MCHRCSLLRSLLVVVGVLAFGSALPSGVDWPDSKVRPNKIIFLAAFVFPSTRSVQVSTGSADEPGSRLLPPTEARSSEDGWGWGISPTPPYSCRGYSAVTGAKTQRSRRRHHLCTALLPDHMFHLPSRPTNSLGCLPSVAKMLKPCALGLRSQIYVISFS